MVVHRAVAIALVVTSAITTSSAFAGDKHVEAEALFDQGKALVEAGRFREACPKLEASLALDPGLGTMLWLADCYENTGQTASAWAHFKEAAARAALAKDPREKVARERVAVLERQLPRLEIVLAPDFAARGEVEVRRDGVLVGRGELGVGIPVDPGTHTVVASAPGRRPWSATVKVDARPSTTAVVVPPLEHGGGDAVAARAPASSGSAQRVTGVVLGGVGLAALGAGAAFSFAAKSTYDDSNTTGHCIANRCDGAGMSLRDDAERQALIATIAMGAGAAAVAGGALLFFTAHRGEVTVAPQATAGGGALSMRAVF